MFHVKHGAARASQEFASPTSVANWIRWGSPLPSHVAGNYPQSYPQEYPPSKSKEVVGKVNRQERARAFPVDDRRT